MELACTIARAGLRVVLVHTVDERFACSCGRGDKCPIKTRGKHPLLKDWPKAATDDEQTLRDQASRLRFDPNVGIALGPQSDGRYIISIDDDDSARMAELEAEHGELPHTMSGQSPRGARLFFALPPDTPLDRVKNVTGIGKRPGVDMKAAGGQVVVAGRNAGGEYSGLDVSVPIAELPAAWTLAILSPIPLPKTAREYTPQTLREDAKAKRKHEAYLDRAVSSECRMVARTGEGQRNTAVYTAACRLLPLASGLHLAAGITHVRDEVVRAGVVAGLSEREAQDTVASAERWVVDNGLVRVPREVPREPITEVRVKAAPEVNIDLIEDNGSPAKIAENVARMLALHPRGPLRWNLLMDAPEWADGAEVADCDHLDVQGWLMSQPPATRVRASETSTKSGIRLTAQRRSYHPVRDYLHSLTWDGVPRIKTMGKVVFGGEDDAYAEDVFRSLMIGAVARVMRPGVMMKSVVVLEGDQNVGKSTALRTLCGDSWFSDTPVDLSKTPDKYQAVKGVWVYELAEIDAILHGRHAGSIKNFVSSPVDKYRTSYGERDGRVPRQSVFVGTTNERQYLGDASGACRFLPFRCGRVDIGAVRDLRDPLWAEAFALHARGEPWWLSGEAEKRAARQSDERYEIDASWTETLTRYLAARTGTEAPLTITDALVAVGLEVARRNTHEERRVRAILHRLGWEPDQSRVGGIKLRHWVRRPGNTGT